MGISVWLFTQDEWLIRDPDGPHVEHERHTVRFDARIVPDFMPYVDQVGKLVGVTDDYDLLAKAEHELQQTVGDKANAIRSQKYYLDVTHPAANKGNAVRLLAKHAGCDDEPRWLCWGTRTTTSRCSRWQDTRCAWATGRMTRSGRRRPSWTRTTMTGGRRPWTR